MEVLYPDPCGASHKHKPGSEEVVTLVQVSEVQGTNLQLWPEEEFGVQVLVGLQVHWTELMGAEQVGGRRARGLR